MKLNDFIQESLTCFGASDKFHITELEIGMDEELCQR